MPAPSGRAASVWPYPDGRICGRAFIDGPDRWLNWEDAGLFHFTTESAVVRAWPKTGMDEDAVHDAFDHDVVAIVLQAQGWQAMHASAAAGERGALLLCGVTHSGKSTLAYALGRTRPWRHAADDYAVFSIEAGQPMLWSRPFLPRLRTATRDHFETPPLGVPRVAPPERVPIRGIVVLEQVRLADRSAQHRTIAAGCRVSGTLAARTLFRHGRRVAP